MNEIIITTLHFSLCPSFLLLLVLEILPSIHHPHPRNHHETQSIPHQPLPNPLTLRPLQIKGTRIPLRIRVHHSRIQRASRMSSHDILQQGYTPDIRYTLAQAHNFPNKHIVYKNHAMKSGMVLTSLYT